MVGHIEWVDFVPVERFPGSGEVVHAVRSFARAAGGGGVVASVLADLGAQVELFTALGSDAFGRLAAAELGQRGVQVHVAWREGPTRRAVTLLEPAGERTIVTIGERLEPLGGDDLPWEALDEADGVYFTAGDAAALAHARRARVLVASPRGRLALEAAGVEIDALVFSSGDSAEREWAARVDGHARLVVTTEGAAGGRWRGAARGSWKPVRPPAPILDTYGCGDSFAAGFTFGLASGSSVAEAAAVGARCGAMALTRPGAP